MARLVALVALALLLSACGGQPSATSSDQPSTAPPTRRTAATRTAAATATSSPSPLPPTATYAPVGPGYQAGFHPLTGLPLEEPESLERSALLVAITNFPPSARPQAGLSQAAHVWETSIGQGLTRFLAVYYGQYPEQLAGLAEGQDLPYDFAIGPVRSGRVAFETIRKFYPEALLVTRAASPEVLAQLNRQFTINALDPQDVNSAGLRPEDLGSLPFEPVRPEDYAGYRFDSLPPAGGQPGPDLRLIYNRFAHVGWEYDRQSGSYGRLQDAADGEEKLSPQVDRLTGEPLHFENVVVLFARHKFENLAGTILEIELSFVPERFGLLLRDGRLYEIEWSGQRGEFRLLDGNGDDLALKPGRTFFEVVSFRSTWDSEERLVRYHSPPLPTLTPTEVFTATPTPSETPTESPTEAPTAPPPTATPAPTATPEPTPEGG